MSRARTATSLDRLLAAFVVLLPFSVAAWRASASAQWRSDGAALRDVALLGGALDGAVSTALTQTMLLLPLGNVAFRSALVGCVALAIACYALFCIVRTLLTTFDHSSKLPSFIAAIATVTAGQSGSWQREATRGGGAMVAIALVMVGWLLASRLTDRRAPTLAPRSTHRWLLLSVLLAATFCESAVAGAVLATLTVAMLLTTAKLPRTSTLPGMLFAAGLVTVALLGGSLLRLWTPAGSSTAAAIRTAMTTAHVASGESVLHAWLAEAGIVTLALAALGVSLGVWRESQRHLLTGVVTLLLLDLSLPLAFGVAPHSATRGLAIAAIALAAGAGVTHGTLFLRNLSVPMARPAATLVVVFHCTIVAVTAEEATFAADRSEHVAAEEWTDAALGRLPARTAVVVRSNELSQRLWAAQQVEGRRPDVVIIAGSVTRSGAATNALLPHEPAAKELLRDLVLTGKASEVSLSELADARPLRVEYDPEWDRRVLSHLRIDGTWLLYAPQTLGSSERKSKGAHALATSGRIATPIRHTHTPDADSQQIVVRTMRQHVTALAAMGMRDAAGRVLAQMSELAPNDPFVTGARLRLAHAERKSRKRQRPVELRDLLRFD